MCRIQEFHFAGCGHTIPSDHEPCIAVEHHGQPQCDPPTKEAIEMEGFCFDCISKASEEARLKQEEDETNELQRVLEVSQKMFEKEEQSRDIGGSQNEMDDLERAIQESINMSENPKPAGGEFDDEELKKVMELSLQTQGEEEQGKSSAPKQFYHMHIKYTCGHEKDMGKTDIEMDPEGPGLPYLVEDDYYSKCPDCGGSGSVAPPIPIVKDPEDTDVRQTSEWYHDLDEVLQDLSEPGQKGKGVIRPHEDGQFESLVEEIHDKQDEQYESQGGEDKNRSANSQHQPVTTGSNEVRKDTPQPHHGDNDQELDFESGSDDESDYDDEDAPDAPPYATVDDLSLDEKGLTGEAREAAARVERARIERLRLESAREAADQQG